MAAIRRFLDDRGVHEVQTPALVPSPGVDRHIDAFAAVRGPGGPLAGYLTTSPEYHMKRLVAAGSGPIYQLGPAFRDGERGPLHNPEFTILEWYRPGWDHHRLMDEVEALAATLASEAGHGGPLARRPYERTTVARAFERYAGVDPHASGAGALRAAVPADGAPDLDGDDRDGWLSYVQAALVEPHLGRERAAFLVDYPVDQCALARIRPGDPPVAERFELYAAGVELANGFHELTDPDEQRARILAENAARAARGRTPYPVDDEFIEALGSMPPTAGVAVGVDRLLMVLLDLETVDDVMTFPGAVG